LREEEDRMNNKVYENIKKDFQQIDPKPSISRYNSSQYKDNEELKKLYQAGYFDGLDAEIGRNYPGVTADVERRQAYAHGFFTGSEELWNGDD